MAARHRRFYSLAELNDAIGELLRQLNQFDGVCRPAGEKPARGRQRYFSDRNSLMGWQEMQGSRPKCGHRISGRPVWDGLSFAGSSRGLQNPDHDHRP
jgi:hypothetical protein